MSAPTRTSDRELTPLTRERLDAALSMAPSLRRSMQLTSAPDGARMAAALEVLLAAGERLRAQKPASDEKIVAEYRSDGTLAKPFHFGAPYICGYRVAERRLLPFADADVRDETEATR